MRTRAFTVSLFITLTLFGWALITGAATLPVMGEDARPDARPLSALTAEGSVHALALPDVDRPAASEVLTQEDQLQVEQEAVYLTNLERTRRGLPPFKLNDALWRAARHHSQDMAANDFFGHVGSDGSTLAARLQTAGYVGWALAGENIAAGYPTAQSVVEGWAESEEHQRNLFSTLFREIGVGYAYEPDDQFGPYRHYWTQDFGYRASVYPVIINNEAYSTASSVVTLYIYGEGRFTEMQISNQSHFAGTTWQPFQTQVTWTLAPGGGERTVYVRLRDSQGSVVTAQDSIWVEGDGTAPTPTPTPISPTPTPTPTRPPKPNPISWRTYVPLVSSDVLGP